MLPLRVPEFKTAAYQRVHPLVAVAQDVVGARAPALRQVARVQPARQVHQQNDTDQHYCLRPRVALQRRRRTSRSYIYTEAFERCFSQYYKAFRWHLMSMGVL